MTGPHKKKIKKHTYFHSQFLHYTNGRHARWRVLSRFAFVLHNLFNRDWLCIRVCVFRLCVCVYACARVDVYVCVRLWGFMAFNVALSLGGELFRHTVACCKVPLVRWRFSKALKYQYQQSALRKWLKGKLTRWLNDYLETVKRILN